MELYLGFSVCLDVLWCYLFWLFRFLFVLWLVVVVRLCCFVGLFCWLIGLWVFIACRFGVCTLACCLLVVFRLWSVVIILRLRFCLMYWIYLLLLCLNWLPCCMVYWLFTWLLFSGDGCDCVCSLLNYGLCFDWFRVLIC